MLFCLVSQRGREELCSTVQAPTGGTVYSQLSQEAPGFSVLVVAGSVASCHKRRQACPLSFSPSPCPVPPPPFQVRDNAILLKLGSLRAISTARAVLIFDFNRWARAPAPWLRRWCALRVLLIGALLKSWAPGSAPLFQCGCVLLWGRTLPIAFPSLCPCAQSQCYCSVLWEHAPLNPFPSFCPLCFVPVPVRNPF